MVNCPCHRDESSMRFIRSGENLLEHHYTQVVIRAIETEYSDEVRSMRPMFYPIAKELRDDWIVDAWEMTISQADMVRAQRRMDYLPRPRQIFATPWMFDNFFREDNDPVRILRLGTWPPEPW